jgi:hypothetical protein
MIPVCYGVQCGERIGCESNLAVIGLVRVRRCQAGWRGKNARIGPKNEEEKEGAEPEDGSGMRGHELQLRDGKVSMTKDKRKRWKNRQLWGYLSYLRGRYHACSIVLALLDARRFLK